MQVVKAGDRIADLERRVRELEQAPRTYPVYVPVYVGPPVVVQPAPVYPYPPTQPWPTYPSPWISGIDVFAGAPLAAATSCGSSVPLQS